jgi:hypothetical protein
MPADIDGTTDTYAKYNQMDPDNPPPEPPTMDYDQEQLHKMNKIYELFQLPLLQYALYILEHSGLAQIDEYDENNKPNFTKLLVLPEINKIKPSPLVMKDIDGFENKYICIVLNIADTTNEPDISYKTYINNDNVYTFICDLIEGGVHLVWEYITTKCIKEGKNTELLQSIIIEFDKKRFIFVPRVISSNTQIKLSCEKLLKQINSYKESIDEKTGQIMYESFDDDIKEKINFAEIKINEQLQNINITDADNEESDKLTDILNGLNKLAASCIILTEEQMDDVVKKYTEITGQTIYEAERSAEKSTLPFNNIEEPTINKSTVSKSNYVDLD